MFNVFGNCKYIICQAYHKYMKHYNWQPWQDIGEKLLTGNLTSVSLV